MVETYRPDPELIDHPLDLGRPELRQIRDRYFPPVALVVAGQSPSDDRLVSALTKDGWRVELCPGPGRTRCPIAEGRGSCALRRTADVAVVFVDDMMWADRDLTSRLLCAADAESQGIIALEGRLDPVSSWGRQIHVGALRDPDELAREIRDVVGPDHAPAPAGPASP